MKILICSGIFPPDIGGPATYSHFLAEELSKRGHQPVVICYSDKRRADGDADYVNRISRSKWKIPHYSEYLFQAFRLGRRADVLYAQDPISSGLPAMVAAGLLGKSFAVKITGDYSWEQAMWKGKTRLLIDEFQNAPKPWLVRLMRFIQIRVCRSAKKVVVPSHYLKRLVAGWGIASEKIEVIYNSVPKLMNTDRDASRRELNLGSRDFYVLTAGRPMPWKGFAVLERVFRGIAADNPDIKTEIAAGLPHGEFLRRLAAADVFVLNSGYEGLAHILLEAMQLGVPIVASDAGGNIELIEQEKTGLLVRYNDEKSLTEAILRLYRDPNLRLEFTSRAKEKLQGLGAVFSQEQMFEQTINLLRQCAS